MKKHWLTLSLVGLIIVGATIAAFFLSKPEGNTLPASVQMFAAQQTARGAAPETAFSIKLGYRVTEEQLRTMLICEPDIGSYALSGGGREWTLTPAAPLAKNTVYTFGARNAAGEIVQSFAFQTETDLLVNSAYPANAETNVKPDAGIEITFNTPGVLARDYFEIKPEISGTFETKDYTFIFKPDAPLAVGNIYRVTVKAGLAAPNGATLAEDYTFSFETIDSESEKWEGRNLHLAGDYSETFLTGDPLAVQLSGGVDTTGLKFDVKLHRYENINDYINEQKAHDAFYKERYGRKADYVADTTGLKEILSFNGEIYRQSEDWNGLYVVLPQDLPEGHYIATLSGKDKEGREQFVQKLLQIRNFSVYAQSTDGDTLLWLNDAVAGEPLGDRLVYLTDADAPETPLEVHTQADGTARVMTGKMQEAYLSVMESGKVTYFEKLLLSAQEEISFEERYYSVLYTDREIYQPTDKIRIWGMVSPRRPTATMPTEIYATLGGEWRDDRTVTPPLYREKLTVKPDGTFEGTLSIGGLADSWYSLRLGDGDKQFYREKGLQIGAYTKPAFVLTTSTDKPFYYADEPITLNVAAHYFDGTPVGNGRLAISSYNSDLPENSEIALDAAGKGSITFKYKEGEYYAGYIAGWQPLALGYTLSNANSDDAYINTYESIRVLPSRVAARFESEEPDSFTFRTARLDDSKLDSPATVMPLDDAPRYDAEFDRLKGAPLDLPVTFQVHRVAYVKTPSGSYYDYLNKKTITSYTYERVETVVQTLQSKTVGGTVTISDLPYKNTDEVTYWLEASFDGGVNGTTQSTFYYSEMYEYFRRRSAGGNDYSFDDAVYAGGWTAPHSVPMGGDIKLGLYAGGIRIENKGKVLVTASQRRTLNVGFFDGNEMTVQMNEDYLPNVRFTGAYFDGRHIYAINPYSATYDFTERTLNVKVTPDKESYKPGDTATVSVAVTDVNGKPVAGSACVGVVDEAVFALASQEVALAEQLYHALYYPQIEQKTSYVEYNLEMANADTGGKGGGGGDGAPIREEFVDTALFQSLEIGADGKGTVTFQLPDNITSWRATAAVVTPQLYAGDNISNTVVTLPFYLRPLFTQSYLSGDDVTIGLNGSGTAVKAGDNVTYAVEALDTSGKAVASAEVSGKLGEYTFINLGKLPAGQYTLSANGKSGSNPDALQQPFSVIEQGLSVPMFQNMTLDELAKLKSVRYPVRVHLYDERMEPYMMALSKLTMAGGDRTERIVASYRARVITNELLDEKDRLVIPRDERLDTIQNPNSEDANGGISALPFAKGDAATTAKLLLVAPELVRIPEAESFLQTTLTNPAATPDDRVMAYVGLAALKKPVLLDMQRMADDTNLTVTQRLYVGAGLAALGDFADAQKLYESLGKLIVTEGKMKYIERGGTADERIADTAAALMLTSIAAHPDADALMRYFNTLDLDRAKVNVDYSLDTLAYLTHFAVPQGTAAGKFTCTLDGKEQTVELGAAGYKPLSLSAQGLAAANFKSVSGKVFAGVTYTGYAALSDVTNSSKLKVEKTVTPVKGALATGSRALVSIKVTFDPDAPSGCYAVSDYIPSGLRFVSAQDDYRLNESNAWLWSSLSNEAQTVRGIIYRNREATVTYSERDNVEKVMTFDNPVNESGEKIETNSYTLQYYVSAALPGEYVAEGVHVTLAEQGIATRGERSTLTIR